MQGSSRGHANCCATAPLMGNMVTGRQECVVIRIIAQPINMETHLLLFVRLTALIRWILVITLPACAKLLVTTMGLSKTILKHV